MGVTGDTQNLLGFGSFVAGANNAFNYSTVTGNTFHNSPAGSGSRYRANLEFSLNGGASSANAVSVNLGQGDATGASVAATATPALWTRRAGTTSSI